MGFELDKDFDPSSYEGYFSFYKGIVTNRKDPEKRGRLQLKVPSLFDDQVHKYWAEPKSMMMGAGAAIFMMPALEDSVWVEFQGGDPRRPVWSFNTVDKQADVVKALYGSDGEPAGFIVQTAEGHLLSMIDGTDPKVTLKHKDGKSLELSKNDITAITTKFLVGDNAQSPVAKGDIVANILQTAFTSLITLGTAATGVGAANTVAADLGQLLGQLETLKSKTLLVAG